MEFLTDMTAQTTNKLEADKRGLQVGGGWVGFGGINVEQIP